MAVTTDIARSWRRPRQVMRDLLAHGKREDRAIAYVLVACFLMFVAQWPRLVRVSEGMEIMPGQEEAELTQLISYAFYSTVIILPLVLYGLAALSHLIAKAFGGQGSWYSARLALFWALLAATPLALLHGLVRGFIGPGPQAMLTGLAWLFAFLSIWLLMLREAETGR